ncbi:MAG: hypothetical protein LKJ94_05670 [Candidatus Methanomethylophilus sp.]|jgi:hypothetical protein|nr:hypothetical protein [Methanomethylophilus sp.]MCI2092510.1 hypothetical protein [Methanomethylophilus sp.]
MLSSKHYAILRRAESEGVMRASDNRSVRELAGCSVSGTRAYCVQLQRMGLLRYSAVKTVSAGGRTLIREEWRITPKGSSMLREAGQ